jgi:hypothetical protein
MRPCQSAVMLPVMPPSRASSLPQVLSTSARARWAGRPLGVIAPTLRRTIRTRKRRRIRSARRPPRFALAVHASSRGRAQVLRSGHRGKDAAVAAPGHGWPMAAGPRSRTGARACRALARHRTSGAKALGYLALLQVTRCKSGTNSRRYPKNGYVPLHLPSTTTARRTPGAGAFPASPPYIAIKRALAA